MTLVPVVEVAWGESRERDVVQRWVELSPTGKLAHRFVKSLEFDPYDVLVLGEKGMPLCALEVKVRRVKLGEYGDVMAPLRKHEYAKQLAERGFPLLLVTEYACGSLVEVDLSQTPNVVRKIARRDRPGMTAVEHGFWTESQLVRLAVPL